VNEASNEQPAAVPLPVVWPAIVTFIVLVGAQTLTTIPFGMVMGFMVARAGERLDGALRMADMADRFPLLFCAMLLTGMGSTVAVAAGTLSLFRKTSPLPVLARSAMRPPIVLVLALLFAFLSLSSLTSWLAIRTGHLEGSMLAVFKKLAGELPLPAFIALFLVGSAGAGFGEEVIFRGVLQRHFIARWDPASGIMLSSLLFGLSHFDLVQGSFAFCVGLVAGWAAWRSGSLWPGVVAHALNNGAAFAVSRFTPERPETAGPEALAIPLGVLALALATIGWLSRRAPSVAGS
jgi:membrane protease YdiL (CAAX protease family)